MTVEQIEVGTHRGMVTLRAAGLDGKIALRVVLPAPFAAGLIGKLHVAALDAEEDYWQVLAQVRAKAASGDGEVIAAAMDRWLIAKDWERVLRSVPGDLDAAIGLVTKWGHVGLTGPAPFLDRRVLALLDPVQLLRIGPGLQQAERVASNESADWAEVWSTPIGRQLAMNDVHAFLAERPWPPVHADPTPEEAEAKIREQYETFLRRAPYQRPGEQTFEVR